jgi:hypothetical protein
MVVQISRKQFEFYLEHVLKQGRTSVFDGLKKHFGAVFHQKINLVAGVHQFNQLAEPVIQMPVTEGSILMDGMLAWSTMEDRATIEAGVKTTGLLATGIAQAQVDAAIIHSDQSTPAADATPNQTDS